MTIEHSNEISLQPTNCWVYPASGFYYRHYPRMHQIKYLLVFFDGGPPRWVRLLCGKQRVDNCRTWFDVNLLGADEWDGSSGRSDLFIRSGVYRVQGERMHSKLTYT